jgi:hypothetical protein
MFGFSIFRLVFNLLFGWLFGHDSSNGFHIFNFNSYICFFLTVLVVAGGSLLIKSYGSYQPERAFIPVNEKKTAIVSSHHQKTTSAQHAHHNNNGHTGKAKAHKPLPHHAKAAN